MKNLITSFLLLVALVSVQATSISIANGDFSSGDLYLSAATPNVYPWTNSISGIKTFSVQGSGPTYNNPGTTVTPNLPSTVQFTAASTGINGGELIVTGVGSVTQGDMKVQFNDVTLTGASNQSTYVLKVNYKYPITAVAGTNPGNLITPNINATLSASGSNLALATTYTATTVYHTKPSVTWTAGQYCTQTNVLTVNSAGVPDKLSFTLQIAKMLSTTGSTISMDNVTLAECTAAVSGVTNTTLAPYQEGAGPSAEQSFSVSGSDLIANLRVTAGSNLEISTTSGSGFVSDSLVLTQTAGTVAPTTIYTRLKAGLTNGTYNDATTKISVTSSSSVNTITAQDLQFTGTVDVATALSQLTGAKLTTNNGTISIDGLAAGELVDVYDSMGKKVKSAIADGGNLKIAINTKGVYVVKIKSFSQKVVL